MRKRPTHQRSARKGPARRRLAAQQGIAVLEIIIVLILIVLAISVFWVSTPIHSQAEFLSQRSKAQDLVRRAEITRQGRGFIPTNMDILEPSSSRIEVRFNAGATQHTVYAKRSQISRSVIDKKIFYQEAVR